MTRLGFRGAAIVVGLMLLLLLAQLSWWILFHEIHARVHEDVQSQLDRYRIENLNHGNVLKLEGDASEFVLENGRYQLRPEVAQARSEHRRHNLLMLISETLFIMAVIGYGSFLVMRSIQSEVRLVRARNVFLNSVTHELKTPIASVKLIVQTLLKRDLKAKARVELLKESVEHLDRLEREINDLLLSAETGKESSKVIKGTCQAGEVVEGCLPRWMKDAERRGGKISVHVETEATIAMDAARFEKVVSNLVQNSMQHGGPKPVVELSLENAAKRRKSYLRLLVRDQGPGIPESELKSVFRPFYRLEGRDSAGAGSGIGLNLVREIVLSVGGTVEALPSKVGACVEVLIPCVKET